jgi:hypothetical protein
MSRIIVASGLGSISSIHREGRRDEALFDAWQQLINSTLRAFVSERLFLCAQLTMCTLVASLCGFGERIRSKKDECARLGESMCTVATDGLGMNETLESLELSF